MIPVTILDEAEAKLREAMRFYEERHERTQTRWSPEKSRDEVP
jgi:hypothetical protein